MPTGVVARFDPRRGYGFVIPDDGGEDVFVHQNNINMEGFRYLKPGEHVSYELEVGEKGLKAVQVSLLDARPPGDSPFRAQQRPSPAPRGRPPRDADRGSERLMDEVEKLRRKQERLISLLVAKGMIEPGAVDGVQDEAAAARVGAGARDEREDDQDND